MWAVLNEENPPYDEPGTDDGALCTDGWSHTSKQNWKYHSKLKNLMEHYREYKLKHNVPQKKEKILGYTNADISKWCLHFWRFPTKVGRNFTGHPFWQYIAHTKYMFTSWTIVFSKKAGLMTSMNNRTHISYWNNTEQRYERKLWQYSNTSNWPHCRQKTPRNVQKPAH